MPISPVPKKTRAAGSGTFERVGVSSDGIFAMSDKNVEPSAVTMRSGFWASTAWVNSLLSLPTPTVHSELMASGVNSRAFTAENPATWPA